MKYRVRIAGLEDMDAIVALGHELLESSASAGIPVNEVKFRKLVGTLIVAKEGWVHVVADSFNTPVGYLMGLVDALYYSDKKFATDMGIYVREEAQGMGYYLVKAFLRWAWSRTGVVQIILGISSGVDLERTGALYEAMGGIHVGGIYIFKRK